MGGEGGEGSGGEGAGEGGGGEGEGGGGEGGGGEGGGGGGESATTAAVIEHLAVMETVDRPPAWPPHSSTTPEAGINTPTSPIEFIFTRVDEQPIRHEAPVHGVANVAPPLRSYTARAPPLITAVRVSPGVYESPQVRESAPRFHTMT